MENTNTMTEQEKQEVMDTWSKEFNEMHDAFLAQHDFNSNPDRQTRTAGAWTRKNILLESWNQFLECEAKMAEFVGLEKEGKGFRTLHKQRRCDIALGFAHYFLASMKEQGRLIDLHEDDK